MISSLFGGVCSTVFGFVFLKESAKLKVYLGIIITFVGGLLYFSTGNNILDTSIYAIAAGFIQGITTTITRSNTLNYISWTAILSSNFIWGIIAIYGWYIVTDFRLFYSSLNSMLSAETIILSLITFLAQWSLYIMMKYSTAQLSSTLSLSRIPASVFLDFFLFSIAISPKQTAYTLFIIVGILVTHQLNSKTSLSMIFLKSLRIFK